VGGRTRFLICSNKHKRTLQEKFDYYYSSVGSVTTRFHLGKGICQDSESDGISSNVFRHSTPPKPTVRHRRAHPRKGDGEIPLAIE
jgi:hypothetical protein